MKNRMFMPEKERRNRSEAVKILNEAQFVEGAIVRMERKCGKENCKCTRGELHVSLYLACRYKNGRKMICIPSEKEEQLKEAVKNYKRASKLTRDISVSNFKRIMNKQDEKNNF